MITIGMVGFLASVTCASLYISAFNKIPKTTVIILVMGCSTPSEKEAFRQVPQMPGRPGMEIGNTNSRLKFGLDPAEFMNRWCAQGPTHHCALGVGRQIRKVEKVARLMDLELVTVSR